MADAGTKGEGQRKQTDYAYEGMTVQPGQA